ncbi:MAG: hypothetical protein KJ060_10445 [Candidatus Hydrogenedentes bacterium]|nr:hypothetical protein [Candidatus Hydrogenedentota bacterium]
MKIVLLLASTFLVFIAGCVLSGSPAWRWLEKVRTETVETNVPAHFPILVRTLDGNGPFAVANYGEQDSDDRIVVDFDNVDPETVKRDLNLLSHHGEHASEYFAIVNRGADFIEVSLRVPEDSESKCVGWYRVQQGAILPQRILAYGPGFAFDVMKISLVVGSTCAAIVLASGIFWIRRSQTRVKDD